jgi:hypothetical protein
MLCLDKLVSILEGFVPLLSKVQVTAIQARAGITTNLSTQRFEFLSS